MDNISNDEFIFADEDEQEESLQKYKILIVDDEQTVHDMTSLAIKDIKFKDQGLDLLHAFSAKEAFEILQNTPDIAVIFLDVIMETDSAGLDLVKLIREDLKNTTVRIILRTGQPGLAPEEEVIVNYDINDYKDKTELTMQKLFSALIAALRSYSDLIKIQRSKYGLEKVLKSTSSIVRFKFINEFFEGLLQQIISLVSTQNSMTHSDIEAIIGFYKDNKLSKTMGTGKYTDQALCLDAIDSKYIDDVEQIFKDSKAIKASNHIIFHKYDGEHKAILLILEGNISKIDVEDDLLDIFIDNAANIYEQLLIIEDARLHKN
jgi:CheY-like chemotaxis protein